MVLKERARSAFIVEGVLLFILGVVAILAPAVTAISITIIFGVLCLVAGIVQLVRVVAVRARAMAWSAILGAVALFAIGVLLLVYPVNAALALALFLGIWFLVHGVMQIGMAIQLRHVSFNWSILLFSGIVSVILSIIIWASWPWHALWIIGIFFGINLIFYGASLFALGFRHK